MKKKEKISHKRLCVLTASIVLGMSSMSVASAGEIISSGGKEVFDVNIVDVTNTNKEQIKKFIICLDDKNPMSISNDNKVGILKGVQYWADILAAGLKTTHPAQIFVSGMANEQNAYATSVGYAQGYFTNNPYWEEYLQGLRDLKNVNVENFTIGADNKVYENGHLVDNGAYGTISFGQFMGATRQGTSDGWWMKSNTVLPDSEQSVDGVAMIRHEVGHALGITAAHRELTDEHGKPVVDQDGNTIYVLPGALTKNNTFLNHIYDQNLNRAGLEYLIVTSKEFERCHAADPSLKPSDFFIVDNIQNKNFTSENPRAGKAFFIGDNVSEVLKGRTFDGVDGLPLKTWEYDSAKNLILDLVHFEIGGLMSHDFYRNITVFNEAELASLQDIGHTIDRRAYFGYSIYNDNITFTNTNGYSARNNAGTGYIDEFSTIPLGIGLHVYGTNNNITQAANIWTKGEGAVGILVNGTGNKLTLAKEYEVHADGTEGVGVLVSYGSNQIFDQQGTVTADGEKGSGVRFDYGSNMLGADEVYRGSFIAYSRDVDAQNGTITKAENDNFYDETDMDKYRPELGGPLISEYNLSGTLSGGENAIYIGKNAFVQAINVNSGASINGNITSNWKQFGDPAYEGAYYYDIGEPKRDILRIQYNGMMEKKGYEYYKYIPDLVTSLNVNTDLKYDGKITGSDNMKLNVNAGTLVYGGAADVVNVNVAKGATLFGGKFTVNDMTSVIAAGFSDATTGKFYNHGTIGAATADDDMVINGNLISDGVLAGYAGGQKGLVVVSGTANVDGSMISINNALPGDEMTVLKADSITGTIGNADESYAASGMLSTTGTVSGNEIKVQTVASNNLGDIDSTQQAAYNAMTDMHKQLSDTGDNRINEMRTLYGLDTDKAKTALSSLSANASAKTMALAQTNTVTSHIISSRLTEAFAKKDVNVTVPGMGLDSGASKDTSMKMKVDQPVDNDFWFKTMRNWGDSKNSSYYQGTTLAGGWDRAYGKHWRAGAFISHGMFSFTDNAASNGIKDTRLGLYGGYSKGAHSGFAYLDYGWINNDLSRKLGGLDMQAAAKYDSRIIELGGEYKFDMNAHQMTDWHMSPYVTVQLSRLTQDGYIEQGAGIFGQRVNRKGNTYFAGGVGMEFNRYLTDGSYALRLGVKHAFSGADPRLTYSYAGNEADTYEMRGQQDRTHFVMSIGGEAEFEPGWTLSGDLSLQKGAHDKDIMAAVTLRRMW